MKNPPAPGYGTGGFLLSFGCFRFFGFFRELFEFHIDGVVFVNPLEGVLGDGADTDAVDLYVGDPVSSIGGDGVGFTSVVEHFGHACGGDAAAFGGFSGDLELLDIQHPDRSAPAGVEVVGGGGGGFGGRTYHV